MEEELKEEVMFCSAEQGGRVEGTKLGAKVVCGEEVEGWFGFACLTGRNGTSATSSRQARKRVGASRVCRLPDDENDKGQKMERREGTPIQELP